MTHVMVRHRIEDFSIWKEVFDNFADYRKSSGEKSYQILQHEEDSNNLYLLFEWDGEDRARKFMESSRLKDAMQEAGVSEAPEIHYLSEAAKGVL